jgi:hypothetical protein
MTTQTGRATRAAADPQPGEPKPWQTPDDARGWQDAGRVRTPDGGPPHITATVDLDGEQSEWVRREARRLRITPVQLLKRLVNEARVAPREATSQPTSSA